MAGTFILIASAFAGVSGTYDVTDGNGVVKADTLLTAIKQMLESGGINNTRLGHSASAAASARSSGSCKFYLDGALAETLFADLPSGMRIATAYVAGKCGTSSGAGAVFLRFDDAHESASMSPNQDDGTPTEINSFNPPVIDIATGFTQYTWKKYAWPTTMPSPKALQDGGYGVRHTLAATNFYADCIVIAGTYTQADPTVTNVNPATGPISGKAVTLTGTNFQSGGTATVTFDGIPATSVVVVDDTTITCVAPANTAGAADVTVTLTGTGPARTGTLAAGFTYVAPAPASLSPNEGSNLGGLAVTITGTYFGADINSVTIGGAAATSVVRVSETSITCVTPAHALPGAVDVVVTDPNDTGSPGTLVGGFTYIAYFAASGDVDGILPPQKSDPVLNWYTYRTSATGWSAGSEPPKKGWWFTNASAAAPFSSRGNTYVTVNV